MIEIWKDVVGYEEEYRISNLGNVLSLKSGKMLKTTKANGYLHTTFFSKRKKKTKYIHILVANAFIGEKPVGLVIDHINGNRTDNRSVNLQYIQQRENVLKGRWSLLNKKKSSKFSGVSWDSSTNKWQAQIIYKGKNIKLIRSNNESVCAEKYKAAKSSIYNESFDEFMSNLYRERIGRKTSIFTGVHWHEQNKKWKSDARYNKKTFCLLYSKNEELCSIVYQEAKYAISIGIFEDFMSNLAEAKDAGIFDQ